MLTGWYPKILIVADHQNESRVVCSRRKSRRVAIDCKIDGRSGINLNGAIGRIFQADVLKDQPFTSAAISEDRAEIATAHRNNS